MKTHRPLHVLGEVHGQEKVHILLPSLWTRNIRSDGKFKFSSHSRRREREIEEFKVFTSCSPSMCLSNLSWLKKIRIYFRILKNNRWCKTFSRPTCHQQKIKRIKNTFFRKPKKMPQKNFLSTTCHHGRRLRPHRGHSAGKEAPQAFFYKVLNQTERFG